MRESVLKTAKKHDIRRGELAELLGICYSAVWAKDNRNRWSKSERELIRDLFSFCLVSIPASFHDDLRRVMSRKSITSPRLGRMMELNESTVRRKIENESFKRSEKYFITKHLLT